MDTVGLAIIAKDEEEDLPRLLESIEGAFQRVVLLDTGSTDNTVDMFSAWAREQAGMTFSVAAWEWKNDFADARNAADRLLLFGSVLPGIDSGQRPLVDWRCWADCDDVVVGARNLRGIAVNAAPEVVALFAGYNYAQNEQGQCAIYLWRERLVRASYKEPWIGRVHEATPMVGIGAVTRMPPDIAEWVHCKQQNIDKAMLSNGRNLAILEQWNKDQPGDTRIVGYCGVENMVNGNTAEAIKFFHEYKTLDPQWKEEHAQINRKLAQCYMMSDDAVSAMQAGFDGLRVDPTWPDSYLTLAEASYMMNEYQNAYEWAELAEQRGAPDTMLIVNPQDYSYLPLKLKALAKGDSGQVDEAVELAQRAMSIVPDQFLAQRYAGWRDAAKREHTANTVVLMADQLVGHDEQVKALSLLENDVPHFVMEHPKVAAKRVEVRQRLRWANKPADYAEHYETGGSKPEDFIAEDNIDPLCEYLPRTNFLLEGLREQQAS